MSATYSQSDASRTNVRNSQQAESIGHIGKIQAKRIEVPKLVMLGQSRDSGYLAEMRTQHEQFMNRLTSQHTQLQTKASTQQLTPSRMSTPAAEVTIEYFQQDEQFAHQMVISFLTRSFKISDKKANDIVKECKAAIKQLRKNESSQTPSRIIMEPKCTLEFFALIVEQISKRPEQFATADLRPILNLILISIQPYQQPPTHASAIKCLDELLTVARPQIWHWIMYTQGKEVEGRICGFFKSIYAVATQDQEEGVLAIQVLVKAAHDKMLELFLCHLPSLFISRHHYLMMLQQTFEMFIRAMVDLTDPHTGVTLLTKFQAMGIPNFIISQCTSMLTSLMDHRDELVSSQQQVAVSLLTKAWIAFPACLSGRPLYAFDDNVDRALEIQARKLICQQNQPGEVLSLLKQTAIVSKDQSLRLEVIQGLFQLRFVLALQDQASAAAIFKTLTFFLVEWHADLVLRAELLREFNRVFSDGYRTEDADVNELAVPLCNIIKINQRGTDYLRAEDLDFFYILSQTKGLEGRSIIAICQVLENYMLRRPSTYRNLADRIFTELMRGKQLSTFQVQSYLKQHANTAITELIEAELELELHQGRQEDAEIFGQIRYLVNHIAGLARGTKIQSDIVLNDHILQTLKGAVLRHNCKQLSSLFLNLGEGNEYMVASRLSMHEGLCNQSRLSHAVSEARLNNIQSNGCRSVNQSALKINQVVPTSQDGTSPNSLVVQNQLRQLILENQLLQQQLQQYRSKSSSPVEEYNLPLQIHDMQSKVGIKTDVSVQHQSKVSADMDKPNVSLLQQNKSIKKITPPSSTISATVAPNILSSTPEQVSSMTIEASITQNQSKKSAVSQAPKAENFTQTSNKGQDLKVMSTQTSQRNLNQVMATQTTHKTPTERISREVQVSQDIAPVLINNTEETGHFHALSGDNDHIPASNLVAQRQANEQFKAQALKQMQLTGLNLLGQANTDPDHDYFHATTIPSPDKFMRNYPRQDDNRLLDSTFFPSPPKIQRSEKNRPDSIEVSPILMPLMELSPVPEATHLNLIQAEQPTPKSNESDQRDMPSRETNEIVIPSQNYVKHSTMTIDKPHQMVDIRPQVYTQRASNEDNALWQKASVQPSADQKSKKEYQTTFRTEIFTSESSGQKVMPGISIQEFEQTQRKPIGQKHDQTRLDGPRADQKIQPTNAIYREHGPMHSQETEVELGPADHQYHEQVQFNQRHINESRGDKQGQYSRQKKLKEHQIQQVSQTEDEDRRCNQSNVFITQDEDHVHHQQQQRQPLMYVQTPIADRLYDNLAETNHDRYLQSCHATNSYLIRLSSQSGQRPVQLEPPENMLPVVLPKTKDQWRGNKIGPTIYGNRIISSASTKAINSRPPKLAWQKEIAITDDEGDKVKWSGLKGNTIFSQQRQIAEQKNKLLTPQGKWQTTKHFEDKDVEVVIQGAQIHPDVYQTQVGLRLGLDGLNERQVRRSEGINELAHIKNYIDQYYTHRCDNRCNHQCDNRCYHGCNHQCSHQCSFQCNHQCKHFTSQNFKCNHQFNHQLNDRCERCNHQCKYCHKESLRKEGAVAETQTEQRLAPTFITQPTQSSLPNRMQSSSSAQTESANKFSKHIQIQTDKLREKDTQSIGTQYFVEAPKPKEKPFEDVLLRDTSQLAKPNEPVGDSVQLQDERPPISKLPLVDYQKEAPSETPQKAPISQLKANDGKHSDNSISHSQSEMSTISKLMKKQTALTIKREIRKGELSLKELIDKFYELEEQHLFNEYQKGMFLHFTYAQKLGSRVIVDADTGEKCISINDFLKYMNEKKIKVSREQICEICRDESDIEAIKFVTFVKLQLLASCAGDKTKLGVRNFKKLMKHMGIVST